MPANGRVVGWLPSRFLTDRAETERALAVAERLGSVNAAAAELCATCRRCAGLHPPRPGHTHPQP
jgi:hypothetical protein